MAKGTKARSAKSSALLSHAKKVRDKGLELDVPFFSGRIQPKYSRFFGRVHSIIYEDSSTRFYVFNMSMDNSNEVVPVTVRGNIYEDPPISVGERIVFEGTWVIHPKYGRQIQIRRPPRSHSSHTTEEDPFAE